MSKLIVLMIGITVVGFIIWWFFGKHEQSTAIADVKADTQSIDIEVNGGYSVETVILKQGVPAVLNFKRLDSSSCLDHVVFPEFGINRELPKGEIETIEIDTSQVGKFQWACGMDMFRGNVIIEK
ncbi:cupredoxin domain-containing protein [Dellaglioa algida]|uniref:Copper-binding protein n=1 Tax=Dellaglioa algida TaxID=105612 RepID=A0A5C6ME91_9LACO|nr:cupredoxin domain-containing protein [Dellaglioa algida]MDK1717111.1 cupredoxin domain-containing protein [Dellaglioa algida]MDK1719819.1 cupredoxin domain-containing protein [Dellaglioa algida]MDK1722053.1 cupredoxin domain-containing protein [Dellaglioa algida]MDK1723162.1 cupredoxin domain-containing protein [Dellaglioa algida]MDK1739886.1 cupredoxin domain-containing protein [Dellaglioa algida]